MNKFKNTKGSKAYVALKLDMEKCMTEWNGTIWSIAFSNSTFLLSALNRWGNVSQRSLVRSLLTTGLVGLSKQLEDSIKETH